MPGWSGVIVVVPLPPVLILSMFAGMGDDLFDAAQMYDEDYLYFFAADEGTSKFASHGPPVPGAGVQGEAAAELAWRLLDLRPGMSVLDLACGHGEMAGQLAARGCEVTGLDSSAVFLDRARADAAAAGVSVENVAAPSASLAPSSGAPATSSGTPPGSAALVMPAHGAAVRGLSRGDADGYGGGGPGGVASHVIVAVRDGPVAGGASAPGDARARPGYRIGWRR